MPYEGPDRCLAAIERMADRGEEYTIRPVDHIYGLPAGCGWEHREPFIGIPVDDSHLFAARAHINWPGAHRIWFDQDSDWPGVNDQDNEWGCDPPVLKAARNQNPAILRAIISRGFLDLLKQEAIYEEHARTLHNQGQHVHRPEYVMRPSRGNRSPKLERVRPWSPFRPCHLLKTPREYRRIRYHPDYEYYEGEFGGWEGTPLLHAVECKLEDNIRTLLDLEVNPNGVSLRALSKYAAVGDRSDAAQADKELNAGYVWEPKDEGMAQIQREFHLHALTETEIEARTRDHVIEPFWVVFCGYDHSPWSAHAWRRHRVPTTSLLEATKGGSVKIFDLLYQSGADATAWLRKNNFDGTAVPHTYSALAPSTPLHAAIESDQLEMLQHLLTLGFSPDSRPLATLERAITPLMSATMRGKLDFYDILVSHGANLHLKTPVMNVHHLHFAAGNLDLRMLRRIIQDIPLSAAGETALGHTVLHVACLPFDTSFICIYSPKVYASVHDIRPHLGVEVMREYMDHMYRHNHPVEPDAPVFTEPQDCTSFEKQIKTVQYLLQNGAAAAISAKDIHGNTPLHYLAGYRTVNQGLVSILRDHEGGQDVWNSAKNRWGHTPRDLWEDGRNCVEEHFKDFWNPETGRGLFLWADESSITFA